VLFSLIKLIQVFKLSKVFLFEISYTIKIIEAPLTYEGIKDLYLSCPAESHICNFIELFLYSMDFVAKSTPIVAYILLYITLITS
jgi:hypothetical protein